MALLGTPYITYARAIFLLEEGGTNASEFTIDRDDNAADSVGISFGKSDNWRLLYDPANYGFSFVDKDENVRFFIDANGNIGMGTHIPSSGDETLKLDVEGPVGATTFCDNDGNNCFTSTELYEGSAKDWSDIQNAAAVYLKYKPANTSCAAGEVLKWNADINGDGEATTNDVGWVCGASSGEGVESDPLFTAWDKSDGITITESQIADLKAYLTAESDPSFSLHGINLSQISRITKENIFFINQTLPHVKAIKF